MKRLLIVVSVLVLAACANGSSSPSSDNTAAAGQGSQLTLAELVSSNQAKLMQLSVGMSKSNVIATMGDTPAKTRDGVVNNPWTSETLVGKGGVQYEALYYLTKKNIPFTPIRKSLTTAIVLKNGKVVGWGEDAIAQYKQD